MTSNKVVFAERSCYNFYGIEFDILVVFDSPGIKIEEPVQIRMSEMFSQTVDKFLYTEIEDYDDSLESMVENELNDFLNDNNVEHDGLSVYTCRLGRKEDNFYD